MKILSGNAHPELARNIASYLECSLAEVELSQFPDGENFAKIVDNIRGQDVYIVQSTCPPNTNDNLMELLILMDAARRASARRITAVVPYFGYARQDRKDQPRVPITAKLVANLIAASGATRVLSVDLHSEQIQGFFDIPLDHLYTYPVIVKHLRSLALEDLVMVAPDSGSLKGAYKYSNMLGSGLAFCAKQRISATEVEVMNVVGDVEGKNCVLVDDMTSTAGTLVKAAELITKMGAKSVIAAVAHSLLTPKGVERLKESPIKEFIYTDTVPQMALEGIETTCLSVAELLGEAISRIHNDQSVTSLFRV